MTENKKGTIEEELNQQKEDLFFKQLMYSYMEEEGKDLMKKAGEARRDPEFQPSKGLDRKVYKAVRRALDELPERDRNLLIYKYVMEMSTDEICAILDIKKDQFGMAVKRAKEKARKLLIKEGVYSD